MHLGHTALKLYCLSFNQHSKGNRNKWTFYWLFFFFFFADRNLRVLFLGLESYQNWELLLKGKAIFIKTASHSFWWKSYQDQKNNKKAIEIWRLHDCFYGCAIYWIFRVLQEQSDFGLQCLPVPFCLLLWCMKFYHRVRTVCNSSSKF